MLRQLAPCLLLLSCATTGPVAVTDAPPSPLVAPVPSGWPAPWQEVSVDESLDGPALSPQDPLTAVCAEYAGTLEDALPTEWRCVVARAPVAGTGRVQRVAVVRLVADFMGVTDVWLLALEEQGHWRLARPVADASYSGVGGWSRAVTVDAIAAERGVVSVYAREFMEDTDLGTNAQMESRTATVTLCDAGGDGPTRCGQALAFAEATLSAVVEDEPPPPEDGYGPIGTRRWQRAIHWDGASVRVSAEVGDADIAKAPALPTESSVADFLAACGAK